MARMTYPREFKLRALKMITDQGLSIAEVARQLGVTEGCLRAWRTAADEHGAAAFPGHGTLTPADDELRQLRAEVVRLKAERDILKKAAAYFASHPL
jgi:transposase